MNAHRGPDSLGVYLTGGWDNLNPDLSLGGYRSKMNVHGLAVKVLNPIPSIRIDYVAGAIGVGEGQLSIQENQLVFTPPDGYAGTPVTIEEGQTRLVHGSEDSGLNGLEKFLRVYREPDLGFWGTSQLIFQKALNGVLSMGDIINADRVAGKTFYRGLILRAWCHDILNLKLWFTNDTQAEFYMGTEEPVSAQGIQAIANETTAPSGIVWDNPTDLSGALDIPLIQAGRCKGLWLKKVFPASGIVSAKEAIQLNYQFEGG